MPTPGLSLLGLTDQAAGINQLAAVCVPKDSSPQALNVEWAKAQAKAKPGKPPVTTPGIPDVMSMPQAAGAHITQLLAKHPSIQALLQAGARFGMVEIEKLLAFQFAIDLPRSNGHCSHFSRPPTLDELLNTALPTADQGVSMDITQQGQSLLIKSPSLNIRLQQQGMLGQNAAGILFGLSLPFVLVSWFSGRAYLSNGYHRAYGARKAGATHIPCIIQDVLSHLAVGIRDDGSTLPLSLLQSNDPPTMAHFTKRRAYPVQVKRMVRIMHVSWCEYAVPDE